MSKSDPKREKLLETAKMLFWKYGIRRVSIEEICHEADVSKMTFYKHFKDKTYMVRIILETLAQQELELYTNIIKSDVPFPEKVRNLVRLKLDQTDKMSNDFYIDLHKYPDSGIQELLACIDRDSLSMVYRDILKAQKEGYLRSGIHPEFIVYFINKIVDMSHDETLLFLYPSPQAMTMELLRLFFFGILPGSEREGTTGSTG